MVYIGSPDYFYYIKSEVFKVRSTYNSMPHAWIELFKVHKIHTTMISSKVTIVGNGF